MKVCIPTMDAEGLGGRPSDHFGSAPFFTFVDTETGECEVVPNGGAHHAHGACRPLDSLGSRSVDAILCRGLGRRALGRLQAGDIEVYVTLERDVDGSVKAFQEGHLRKLSMEEACGGHQHGGHQHSHAHGCGDGEG
jgi:predicted Fe-Mo cluster-binding NifX family protein